jgi:lipid-A-disaccharide synthase
VRFPVACYKPWHYDRCAELIAAHGRELPIDLYLSRTPEVIETSDCCLMVSGSVSLELLARRKPAAVIYRAGALMYFFANLMKTCRFMTLPNLMVDRPLYPEFPCFHARGEHIGRMIQVLDDWLADPATLAQTRRDISALADQVVEAGGVARAAEAILQRTALPRRSAA